MMGNSHNSQHIKFSQPEQVNVQYHKWIDDIYAETKNVWLKPINLYQTNGLELLDKFLEKFRLYIQKKQEHSSKTQDYQLLIASTRLMLLIRELILDKNDRNYLMKLSEILGGCTFLWLRYFSLEDEQYNATHIQSILSGYVIYLQSTTDESFLLKIIAHALYMCRKLPKVFYKILDLHLRERLQVIGRGKFEGKEDQLYILYIIAFKLWDRLQPEGDNKIDVAKYANSYMKPMISLLRNARYAPNLPKITLADVKSGKATGIVIKKLLPSRLLKLAEAVVKEDWLKGSDINTPIIVDLSIDDDVDRSEAVEKDRTASVNSDILPLSIYESSSMQKYLWWVQTLHTKFMKSGKKKKENYRIVEVIDLVDEDMSICESICNTNAQTEVQNRSKADQSKEVENLTATTEETNQNQISREGNSQAAEPHRPAPEGNKEKNPNDAEKVNKLNNITREGDNNCSTKIVDKNLLAEPEVRNLTEFRKLTGALEEDEDIALLEDPIDILELEEDINEIINHDVNAESKSNKLEKIGKTKLIFEAEASLQDAQIIQGKPMQTETTVKETIRILQTESTEQSSIAKSLQSDVCKEKHVTNFEIDTEHELNLTHTEVMSEKDCHSSKLTQKNNDMNEICTQSHNLIFESNEEKRVKNNENIKKITSVEMISSKVSPQVPDAIELSADASEDDEVTSIICMGETIAKSPIIISESDGSEGVSSLNTKDDDGEVKNNLPERSTLMSVDEDELVGEVIANRPIRSIHEKKCHSIDEPLNSSVESLQINDYPKTQSSDDDRVIDDNISISSIVEESENYDTIDPKIDDIHIEKISPLAIVKETNSNKNKSDGSVLFSVSSRRKLSPPRQVEESAESFNKKSPNKDRIVFSTSTSKAKRRGTSPSYAFIPASDIEHDEIKSPPVESFSKSDTDEFKKIFNNKNHINAHRREKEVTARNIQTEKKKKLEHTVENIINKKANQVIQRSILTKTDGNCQNENISTSNVKRKAVSFATVTQDKPPLIINRISNVDSTIIERKTYDSPLTIQNDPQVWRSSINNSPLLSNQQDRTSQEQDQELELLSTSDVNSLGSSSPPPTKESDQEWNQEDASNATEDTFSTSSNDGRNTSPLDGSLLDIGRFSEHEKMSLRRDYFATQSQLCCNSSRNSNISPTPDSISIRASISREHTISPSIKNVEVLEKISSMQQPYHAMSDFDRYLEERKRVLTPKRIDLPRRPVNLVSKVDSPQKSKSDNSDLPESKLSRIDNKSEMHTPTSKTHKNQEKGGSDNFNTGLERKNSFNDPKLKKKVTVQLKNYTPSQLKKLMVLRNRRSASESSSIISSDIERTPRSLSASSRENVFNKIENAPKSRTVATSIKSPSASPTVPKIHPSQITIKSSPPKEPMLILRDKGTDIMDSKPTRKRRSSGVFPDIVVRVFKDKNNKKLNPCVMLKKMDMKLLSGYIKKYEKYSYKHRKEKSRRISEEDEEDEMSDYSISSDRYYNTRSNSRASYSRKNKTNNYKHAESGLPSQSNQEFDQRENEISEIDLLYPSTKRCRTRSKSRSRSRSRSKSKSEKRRNSNTEFSETDFFLNLCKNRSRSRSKSKSKGRSKSKDTHTDYSDGESISPKKRKSKSGRRSPPFNKNTIDKTTLDEKEDNKKIVNSLDFYHEFHSASSDEETLFSTKKHKHSKRKDIDADTENLNVRDKSVSPITLPFDLNRPLSSPSFSGGELSNSGSPIPYTSSTSRVRRISDIDINFERTHQKSFKEFSDQLSNLPVPDSEFNVAQIISNENDSDSIQESPLFILAEPNDTFIVESGHDGGSTSKHGKSSSKNSNSSSDTSDLAILPKRRKMLDLKGSDCCDESEFITQEKSSPTVETSKRKHKKHKSGKKKKKSLSSSKSNSAESRSSGSRSPEMSVNINKAKTYSKSNIVQNVFVPAELEMNFDNPSRLVTTYAKSRKALSKSPEG